MQKFAWCKFRPLTANSLVQTATLSFVLSRILKTNSKMNGLSFLTGKRNVVIDCDCGIDDAQALIIALTSSDVNVVAVTCVFGNCAVDLVFQNVLRTLATVDRLDIPVFIGSDNSLIGTFDFAEKLKNTSYHGHDGLGNVESTYWQQEPYASIQSRQQPSNHAAVKLVEIFKAAAAQNQPLSLLALGPLTNIALAFRLDSNFGSYLNEVLIMGGGYAGRGNMTAVSEHNFLMDPEAAQTTLHELRRLQNCKTLLFGLEVCQEGAIEWSWLKEYMWHGQTVTSRFLAATFKWLTGVYEEKKLGPRYFFYDEWLTAYLRDPEIVERTVRWPTSVELSGQLTRGMCVTEKRAFPIEKANAEGTNNIRHVVSLSVSRMKTILAEVAGPKKLLSTSSAPLQQNGNLLTIPAEQPARKKSSVAEAVSRDFSSYVHKPSK